MNIKSSTEYTKIKVDFLSKHIIKSIDTSAMVNNEYHKIYMCEDGKTLYEHIRHIWRKATVTIGDTEFSTDIELIECECWSDEFSSMYYYEKA